MSVLTERGGLDRLSRDDLNQLQYSGLAKQIERVYRTSDFYRRRFDDEGFAPDKLRSLNDVQAIPFVTKADLVRDQEAHPPLGSRLCVEEKDIARFEITSGTSGLGQEAYALTNEDMTMIGANAAWALSMGGITATDRLAGTLPLGYLQGPWGAQWAAQVLGCGVLHLGLATESQTKIRYLQRFGINAIYGVTPTFLMRLTTAAEELGIDPRSDLPDLRRIWITAESYPIEWVERAERHWGVRLFDVYGSTGGAYAASCEVGLAPEGRRGRLHNADWGVLLEVVNPETGSPVAEGEIGEAVITTLMRQASPLIRFRTGDRVRLLPARECPCGRQTAAIEAGAIGRLDDMLKIKGMNVWPSAVDEIVLGSAQIEEYNATVGLDDRGYEYLRIDVVFHGDIEPTARPAHLGDLKRRLRSATNVTMQICEADMDSMRKLDYKARRWNDLRPADMLVERKPMPA
jgi:phenylacetate-CoA ligase